MVTERKSLDNENENEPRCWNGNEGWVFGGGLLILAYFLVRQRLKEKYDIGKLKKEQKKEKAILQKVLKQLKKKKK